jgi:hypothetical protein
MSRSLSRREVRQLKEDAAAFARKAKPGRTYYCVAEYAAPRYRGDDLPKQMLDEVVFGKPKKLYGPYPHWYATLTAYECYLKQGPLYEDRDHPAIRGIPTSREYSEAKEKFVSAMFSRSKTF